MNKKVIIIGAGISGLTTAARLLSRGYEVKVVEKQSGVGGKLRRVEGKGYKFDLTASIMIMPSNYKDVFKDVGKNIEDYIKIKKLHTLYRVNFSDKYNFEIYDDINETMKMMQGLEFREDISYIKFIEDAYSTYKFIDKNILRKSFLHIEDYVNYKLVSKAHKLKGFKSSYEYISNYIKSEKLREFLSFQCLYMGISPYSMPAIYSMIPAVTQVQGIGYVEGGVYSYVKALEKLVLDLGGVIELNSEVREILVDKDKVTSVITSKEYEKCDIAISSADYSYTVEKLLIDNTLKERKLEKKINDLEYSCSTFILRLGVKKKYNALKVHNMYIGENFKENIECVFEGELPQNPPLYIYCPSAVDQSMAEGGGESMNVMVRVPNLQLSNISWNDNDILMFRNKVINNLKKINGLEDIEDNIEYEAYLTPVDLEREYSCYKGAAFGILPNIKQITYKRPKCKLKNIKNLYFLGDSVHPGAGMSIVQLATRELVNEVERDTEKTTPHKRDNNKNHKNNKDTSKKHEEKNQTDKKHKEQ